INIAINGKTVKSAEYVPLERRLDELKDAYKDAEKAFNTKQIQEMVNMLGRDDIGGGDLSNLDNLVSYTRDRKVYFVNSQGDVPEGSDEKPVKVLTLDQTRKALEIEKEDVERETQNFAATA